MARKALGPATLELLQAVENVRLTQSLASSEPQAAGIGQRLSQPGHSPVMVACSGGADSVALAAVTALAGRRGGFGVRAVIVDHGLQDGSASWADEVARRLADIELAAEVVRVVVSASGAGPEADARSARYRALTEAAGPEESIYLGHTLDDQAETVLLGLARGSGARSLAGMPAVRGPFVRPFLGVRREVTRAACRELGLTWDDDPHNSDPRFTRVRVRRDVLPVLERELGPGVTEALARSADLLRDDADLLEALADDAAKDVTNDHGLAAAALGALPRALSSRVIRQWLLGAGASEVTRSHVEAVLALVTRWRGQAGVDLPGLCVVRRDGRLVVVQPPLG